MSQVIEKGCYIFPASFAQRRLWFVEQAGDPGGAYNVSFGLRFRGALNRAALGAALSHLEERHEILRTTFVMEEEELSQVVRPARPFPLRFEALDQGTEPPETRLFRKLEAEITAPFDLATGPLLRAALFRLGPLDHALAITLHHIIVDAWSIDVFIRELATAYGSLADGGEPALPPLPIQYADYALWQLEGSSGERLDPMLAYWRHKFAAPLPELELPTDRPRPPAQQYRGGRVRIDIPEEIADPLRRMAREANATLFMALLATFQVFLYRHTGQTDLVTGTPITGRNRPETTGLIGFFLNMLALRTDLSGGLGFRELLTRVRGTVLDAYDAQDVPFERLVEILRIPRDHSRHPLFQTVFVLHGVEKVLPAFAGLAAERLPLPPGGTSKFDLLLSISDSGRALQAEFEYNSDLFDRETVARMAERYRILLAGIGAAGQQPLAELPLLTPSETIQVLKTWNETTTEYPRDRGVHRLFEEQVDAAPDAVAVIERPGSGVAGPRTVTYRELDLAANRLAHHLRGLGVVPRSTVGVALERSVDFVVAALAVLKAGASYVPVDPSLPLERLEMLLEEADVVVLLTGGLLSPCPRTGIRTVSLDPAAPEIALASDARLRGDESGDAPAYVMYTSGSTGRPKGVSVPHRAVARLVRNTNYINLTAADVVLACAPVSFDASTFEIWGSLLNGGRLVLHMPVLPEPADLAKAIREHGVTTLWLTAGLFHLMTETHPEGFAGLRQLLAGGDVLSPAHVRKALQHLQGGVLINGYGPTENTTFTCCYRMSDDAGIGETVPIGRPVSNTRVYVLDEGMRPVPPGVRGELWTSGDGLAVGYLNDARLTGERFLPDPFSDNPTARIYRTGDIVRHRADGALEYRGRSDNQVKIRGYRVELAEVESSIARLPGVSACAVTAFAGPSGHRDLVAYVVATSDAPDVPARLKDELRRRVPDFMIPTRIVVLERLPLTGSGKVDRKALPGAADQDGETPGQRIPHTTLELALLSIWQRLLPGRAIRLDDDFFALGGHSLLAVRMVEMVAEATGHRLSLAALFHGATIRLVARYLLEHADTRGSPELVVVQRGEPGVTPFAMVHGDLTGGGFYCRRLAEAAGPAQPVFSIPPCPDDTLETLTIQGMARRHLEALRREQPAGPYQLGGYCIGGLVAFEMARQLRAAGEEIDLLVLVDAAASNRRYRWAAPLVRLISQTTAWNPVDRMDRFAYIMRRLRLASRLPPASWMAYMAGVPFRVSMRRVRGFARRLGWLAEAPAADPGGSSAALKAMRAHHTRAMYTYFPGSFDRPIELVLPVGERRSATDPTRGWERVASEVRVTLVKANHVDIVLTGLPGILRDMLAKLRGGDAAKR